MYVCKFKYTNWHNYHFHYHIALTGIFDISFKYIYIFILQMALQKDIINIKICILKQI